MTDTIQNLPAALRSSAPAQPRPCPPPPSPAVNLPSFETVDRVGRSMIARFTGGISPHAEADAWFDWCSHFSRTPGRQLELAALGAVLAGRLAALMTAAQFPCCVQNRSIIASTTKLGRSFRFSGGSKPSSRKRSGGAVRHGRFVERRLETPRNISSSIVCIVIDRCEICGAN